MEQNSPNTDSVQTFYILKFWLLNKWLLNKKRTAVLQSIKGYEHNP